MTKEVQKENSNTKERWKQGVNVRSLTDAHGQLVRIYADSRAPAEIRDLALKSLSNLENILKKLHE